MTRCPIGSLPPLSNPGRRNSRASQIRVDTLRLTLPIEKLLSNGDKWEPELAAAIRADAPYR